MYILVSPDVLVSTYSRSTYMHIIRTCMIGRSTHIRCCLSDLRVQSRLQFYMIFRTRPLQQQKQQQMQLAAARHVGRGAVYVV